MDRKRRCQPEGSNIISVVERVTHGANETESLAAQLGQACRGGELLLLTGELGAGKTCFVRGLARGLGCDPTAVKSPSFTLLHTYGGRCNLHHFDVYFTVAAADLERSSLVESLAAGDVAVVEWGERFADLLPADRLEVELRHVSPEERQIFLRPRGQQAQEWLIRAMPEIPPNPG